MKYIQIPEWIIDRRLSSDALAAAIWFVACGHDAVKPDWVKNRFAWGDTVWRRVSKELREQKLLRSVMGKAGTILIFNLEGK
jgi:hypothetical protein